jgi:23S rRNA pseudouridine1911/1915/1917 synthase
MADVEQPTTEFVEIEFCVEPNYAGWRLDLYLCAKIRRLSRTRVKAIIERELLCERKLKPSSLVTAGLKFRLRRKALPEPEVPAAEEVKEIYRDDWLLILDKPAGLPIHPTARYHHGTLVSQLKARGEAAWPAHRLDRETSGLLVCARSVTGSQRLMLAFSGAEVHKEYVAICEGHPSRDEFEVDAPISEGTELIRIAVRIDRENGKPAQTRFVVERRFSRDGADFAVLRCFPRTGRQHQIRIHLQQAGFPLVGDKMYGADPGYFDRFTKHCLEPEAWAKLRLPRHALHAAKISFDHPGTRAKVSFESPLPQDLLAFSTGQTMAEATPSI